ncbi:hypothetical protein K1719_002614 [Acacia pycnantha]|nr:hypothetical protein K1719_002614 [Acacia pycnantha]
MNDSKDKTLVAGPSLERRNKVLTENYHGYEKAVAGRESNLEPHTWREVQMDGKENLNPGERGLTAHREPDGDINRLRFDRRNEEQSDGICMSMEEVCPPLALGQVIKSRGFKKSEKVEAEGFSGGIWLLWNIDELVVNVKVRDEQFLHCDVNLGGEAMLFTTIYASPIEQKRIRLWDTLLQLASGIFEPWLLAGDFNDIKTPLEQIGGGRVSELRCRRFNEWIEDCKLIDIEAKGPLFTWKGPKWEGLERVYKRLDRCLCSTSWQDRFEEAEVRVLPRLCSDHHPILVSSCLEQKEWRPRLFRYEAMWKLHDYFDDVLLNSWQGNGETPAKLENLQQDLLKWNHDVFGQIANRAVEEPKEDWGDQ